MDETQKTADDFLKEILEMKNPWGEPPADARPMYYKRDGTPIVGEGAVLEWAAMFEDGKGRRVAVTITPYGERLSTVFLGMDHNWSPTGPAIIFETMLFAPESDELKKSKWDRLRKIAETGLRKSLDGFEISWEQVPEEKYNEKHYPHDQLQDRYATEAQALAGHRRLKLQCLIPPRWRRLLLYTIGRDELWR